MGWNMGYSNDSDRILIVQGGADSRLLLSRVFTEAGYEPVLAANGREALRAFFSTQPSLALLDVQLPEMNGLELCSRIREASDVPVIMFTAVEESGQKVDAFNRGADDYIVRTPAAMDELLPRVRTVLRRANRDTQASTPARDVYADEMLEIDFARCSVTVRGAPVMLTPIEFQLLGTLVQRAGQPVRSGQLLRMVWGEDYNTDDLVKWHIRRLRRKIEDDAESPKLLVTRRGFGYVYMRPQAGRDGDGRDSGQVPVGALQAAAA